MILDVLLAIPTFLITTFWNALQAGTAYPAGVYTAATSAGNYLARLNFILPIDTLGDLLGWYLVAVIAYFSIWILLMVVNLYQAFKLF